MELLYLWEKIELEFSRLYGVELCEFLFLDSKLLTFANSNMVIYLDDLSYSVLSENNSTVAKSVENVIQNITSSQVIITYTKDINHVAEAQFTLENQKKEVEKHEFNYNETNLDSEKHFSNYFYGYDNKKIIEVCKSLIDEISNESKISFNPLFIYGSSGIGKTHVVTALGNEIFKSCPHKRILFNNANDFTNEYTNLFRNSLESEKLDQFKEKYHNLDVFIIDDLQMLQTKEGTLSEFFSIFEGMKRKKKLVIITCDVAPSELKIEDRLLSRFLSGLVIDMKYPDTDTMTQIFQYYTEDLNVTFEKKAVSIFVEKAKNVRELEGYTNAIKVDLIASSSNKEIYSAEDAMKRIASTYGNYIKPTKTEIMNAIRKSMDITKEELTSKSRITKLVNARNVATILLKEEAGLTFQEIGIELGMKDHSNASKIYKKEREIKTTQKVLFTKINTILNK